MPDVTDRRLRALVYGDVDLNLVDGSAIWLQSMVQALTAAGVGVTLLLKARVRTSRLLDPLTGPGITVVPALEDRLVPGARGPALTPAEAVRGLRTLDVRARADLVVLRGRRVAALAAAEPTLAGRLWTYLTDVPQHAVDLTDDAAAELDAVAAASRLVLCQTEELRGFLETVAPAACGRTALWPPVLPPPDADLPTPSAPAGRELRLVYTGKMARRWRTLEMTRLPAQLAARDVPAVVHIVGDKVHDEPAEPRFAAAMRAALARSPGVVTYGGVPRRQAMRIAAGCHVGLCWRHPSLDASLELSTKLLEFGALGLPVVLNRTPAHEELLGAGYPLFAADQAEVLDVLAAVRADPAMWAAAAAACRRAAAGFGLDRAVGRLRVLLAAAFPPVPARLADAPRPLRIGVAGHDLKFFTAVLGHLRSLPGVEVRVDAWPALAEHDAAASGRLRDWADVVMVEWCGPAALWYAGHKRPGSRLVVRLHRFELYGPWPAQLAIDAIDAVACVSAHYAQLTLVGTGWPAHKVVVVPNSVDVAAFDRPKLPGAEFHLGFIGMAPMRKRLDLALDVLELLRHRDARYRLSVKTKMPWDYWWIWQRAEERQHAEEVLRRVQSPHLRHAVVFDGFGPDVARWLRGIGFVLSTSDDESFHLAPAEGMASGAVPALLGWPGADTVYDRRWISGTPAEMAESVAAIVGSGSWESCRRLARDQARTEFDLPRVLATWTELLTARAPA